MFKKKGSGFADDILAEFSKSQSAENEKNAGELSIPTTKLGSSGSESEITRRIPVIEVDPHVCEPWTYHNRDRVWLTKDNCSDLISSIARVGQQEPVLLRKAPKDANHKYDVIYGVRRWFACKELKGQKLLARLTDADDRECMILMHVENADSKDITDFERACSFKQHYGTGLFSSQKDFAQAMNMSEGNIAKMFAAAELADFPWFNEFANNKAEVPLKKAYKIASSLRSSLIKEIVTKEIEGLRQKTFEEGKKISTRDFINFLDKVIFKDEADNKEIYSRLSQANPHVSVKVDTKKRLVLQISPGIDKKAAEKLMKEALTAYFM